MSETNLITRIASHEQELVTCEMDADNQEGMLEAYIYIYIIACGKLER